MRRLLQGVGRVVTAPLRAVRRRDPSAESGPEACRPAAPFYRDSSYYDALSGEGRPDPRRRGAARGAPRTAQGRERSSSGRRASPYGYGDDGEEDAPRRRFALFRRKGRESSSGRSGRRTTSSAGRSSSSYSSRMSAHGYGDDGEDNAPRRRFGLFRRKGGESASSSGRGSTTSSRTRQAPDEGRRRLPSLRRGSTSSEESKSSTSSQPSTSSSPFWQSAFDDDDEDDSPYRSGGTYTQGLLFQDPDEDDDPYSPSPYRRTSSSPYSTYSSTSTSTRYGSSDEDDDDDSPSPYRRTSSSPYSSTSTSTRYGSSDADDAAPGGSRSLRQRIAQRQAAQASSPTRVAAPTTMPEKTAPVVKRRRRVGGDPWRYRLYFMLQPRRLGHIFGRVRRLSGPAVWERKPGLDLVPKAIQWARDYRRHESRFRDIETLRQDMLADGTKIESIKGSPTVAEIVHHDGTRPRWGALLNGLVFHTHTQRVLELGTDVGIASLYLARGLLDIFPMRTCALVTLDDNAETLRFARRNFRKIGFDDVIWVHEGPIIATLPEALKEVKPLDLVFIDGRHNFEATVQQFMRVRPATRTGSLIVISHIHRSPQMYRAWQAIQQTRRVAATVDLWHWGIVVIGDPPAVHLHAGL